MICQKKKKKKSELLKFPGLHLDFRQGRVETCGQVTNYSLGKDSGRDSVGSTALGSQLGALAGVQSPL